MISKSCSVVFRMRKLGVKLQPMILNFSSLPDASLPDQKTEMQIKKDAFYRQQHEDLSISSEITDEKVKDDIRRRRMIYRSKQRGFLECDLLMGSWAVINVPLLSASELDEYDKVLKEETLDLFNYVTCKEEPPAHLKNLGVMLSLQQYSKEGTIAGVDEYANVKRDANLT